jgi:hypothetical protein
MEVFSSLIFPKPCSGERDGFTTNQLKVVMYKTFTGEGNSLGMIGMYLQGLQEELGGATEERVDALHKSSICGVKSVGWFSKRGFSTGKRSRTNSAQTLFGAGMLRLSATIHRTRRPLQGQVSVNQEEEKIQDLGVLGAVARHWSVL